jgi:hypothetical protein
MPAPQEIKKLLIQTIFKKAKWETARILVKSPKNRSKEIEDISVLHMWEMLLLRVHEEVSKQWEWATGASIPVTLKDVLEAAEKVRKTQRD